jgi:hypothetical protein
MFTECLFLGSSIAKSIHEWPISHVTEKTMKALVVIWLALFCPISAFAGNILGNLSENHQPVKGADITVTCGSNTYQTTTSDDGAYSLRPNEAGRCMFSVKYKGQSVETEIFSYDQPTRYDFELAMTGGKYALKKMK